MSAPVIPYAVDIDAADRAKRQMATDLQHQGPRVLNTVGAFASLCDGAFPGMKHPVLVCKTEEPGSKQVLAIAHGYIESICQDMIHHLINDVIVMGATPLFIQDLIVCGKLEPNIVNRLVRGMAATCAAQGCALTGGETSEQPDVLRAGTYVLGSSCIGIVDKDQIIDGRRIRMGDSVLALESSGLHTNGYTLVRSLLAADPTLATRHIGERTFLDAVLEPHRCYFRPLQPLLQHDGLHGLAHITGGGIPGNLHRILPAGTSAEIDASSLHIPPIFSVIHDVSGNGDAAMIKTFNLGVGITAVVDPAAEAEIIAHLEQEGIRTWKIGQIADGGDQAVHMHGTLRWMTC